MAVESTDPQIKHRTQAKCIFCTLYVIAGIAFFQDGGLIAGIFLKDFHFLVSVASEELDRVLDNTPPGRGSMASPGSRGFQLSQQEHRRVLTYLIPDMFFHEQVHSRHAAVMYAVKPNVNALSSDAECKDFGALLQQISKYI